MDTRIREEMNQTLDARASEELGMNLTSVQDEFELAQHARISHRHEILTPIHIHDFDG